MKKIYLITARANGKLFNPRLFTNMIFAAYPNKRVKHLTKHAKKARTRKKNINRIIKDITTA